MLSLGHLSPRGNKPTSKHKDFGQDKKLNAQQSIRSEEQQIAIIDGSKELNSTLHSYQRWQSKRDLKTGNKKIMTHAQETQ